MPFGVKNNGPNLHPHRPQNTLEQRSKAPEEIRGKANRSAWASGFKVGAAGEQCAVPYMQSPQTSTLRRSWLQGWETGAKSRFETKGMKKEPSRA